MDTETQLALISQDIGNIKNNIGEIKDALKNDYVTMIEFDPVKRGFYGVIIFIVLAVIGAGFKLLVGN